MSPPESMQPHAARKTLAFGAALLLPLVWSVATEAWPGLANVALRFAGPRYLGPYLALAYGSVLLAMLSGVLIGLALRGTPRVGAPAMISPGTVALAALPGLWAFVFAGGGPVGAALWLGAGYVLVLAIDWRFWRLGLAPVWWWPMRLIQTAVILPCLLVTAFG